MSLKMADVLAMTTEQRAALTDEQIRNMAYAIHHYSPSVILDYMPMTREERASECKRQMQIINTELAPRLAALEQAAQAETREPELTRCDCGHRVPRLLVMTTSNGSSCPDCYDRTSN